MPYGRLLESVLYWPTVELLAVMVEHQGMV